MCGSASACRLPFTGSGLDTARPLLLGNVRGRLIKLLGERTPLYEEVAAARVDTDDASPEEVVETIVRIWPPEK